MYTCVCVCIYTYKCVCLCVCEREREREREGEKHTAIFMEEANIYMHMANFLEDADYLYRVFFLLFFRASDTSLVPLRVVIKQ
jgi:hypothetical protein